MFARPAVDSAKTPATTDRAAPGAVRPNAMARGGIGNRAALMQLARPAPAGAVTALRAEGEALPDEVRGFFEPRLGEDLSAVRIHAGAAAEDGALAAAARAYTVGQDIVFGAGEYAPATPAGRRVLAHELAHVMQARRGAPPALRRFASDEHKSLGDDAGSAAHTDINIGTDAVPDYLTFGDAVALAGDYFGSLDELRAMAANDAERPKLRWVYWWALGKDKGKPEPALAEAAKQKIKDDYFRLASQNKSHFSAGGTAAATYKDQHTLALKAAYDAGIAAFNAHGQPDLKAAQTQEAFAQHFLSDMFSAGHVRTERIAIKAWYDTNMPQSITQFVAYMAAKMHQYLVDKHSTANAVPLLHLVPDEAALRQRIVTLGGAALQAFSLGDIVSLAQHNFDSQGLDVVSETDQSGQIVPNGFTWRAVGDAMLNTSPQTRAMAVAAMRASLGELDTIAKIGLSGPKWVYPDGGFGVALTSLGDFAALKFVPQAASGNKVLKWQWGFMNRRMFDAVDAAVKGDIVAQLKQIAADQKDQDVKDALGDFAGLLEILGVTAIEQAVGEPARQKQTALPGMYDYKPPGPDD